LIKIENYSLKLFYNQINKKMPVLSHWDTSGTKNTMPKADKQTGMTRRIHHSGFDEGE